MPFLTLIALSLITFFLVSWMASWITRTARRRAAAGGGMEGVERRAGEVARRHERLRELVARRLDPTATTGLMLTVALAVAVTGGVVLAAVTYLVRATTDVEGVDQGAADWAHEHATALSTDALRVVTDLGDPTTIIILAVVFAVVATAITRSRWTIPFIAIVVAGNGLVTTTIKELADRARPALDPAAASLGPSFPSGHSSWSAAFFAAAALVLSRGAGPRGRAVLAGAAAGLAVAVAASRVLLAVHWVSDVVAGLVLGWAWFAICAIAFGGRLLRFGAAAEAVRREAAADPG